MQGKKLKLLRGVLGSHYKSGEETLFFCPKCKHHKKKLSVNIDADKFKCWVCDYAGHSIRRLVRDYGSSRVLGEWDELTDHVNINSFDDLFNTQNEELEQRVFLPKEFRTLTSKTLPLHASPVKRYLANRGLDRQDMLHWKIGYCVSGQYEGRVIVPSFSDSGELNYFVARSYNNHWKKYMNPPVSRNIVFNDLMIDWNSDIILVEGVFDAIKAGPNAIPLLGSQLNERSKLFQTIVKHDPRTYLALDADAEKKSTNLIKKLLTYGVELYKVEVAPYSDVGEMSRDEFRERKDEAKPIGDFFRYVLDNS